jgi:hypothetical protein
MTYEVVNEKWGDAVQVEIEDIYAQAEIFGIPRSDIKVVGGNVFHGDDLVAKAMMVPAETTK